MPVLLLSGFLRLLDEALIAPNNFSDIDVLLSLSISRYRLFLLLLSIHIMRKLQFTLFLASASDIHILDFLVEGLGSFRGRTMGKSLLDKGFEE